MTDIHGLEKGDRVIFTNGHESLVRKVIEHKEYLAVYFTNEKGFNQDFYFLKNNGIAPCTYYEIVKVIKHV